MTARFYGQKKTETRVKALSSGIALSIPDGELAGISFDPEKTFISAKLIDVESVFLSSNEFYFKRPKDLKFTKAAVQTDLSRQGDHYVLRLSSSNLAPRVEITFGDEEVSLSDNYFDILPSEPVSIRIKSTATLEQLKKTLKIESLDQL